jgi:small GTP-binding protein
LRKDIAAECIHQRLLSDRIVSTRHSCPKAPTGTNISTSSEPTVFENYVHDIFIDNTHVELSLWDTAGQEEFDRLRSLSYDDTHAIMLCFSVDSPDSLENVESKWVGEIAENCPGVKLVLVALKCDLREQEKDDREDGREPKKPTIDYKQGLAVAEKVKALRYLGMLWHNCEQRIARDRGRTHTNKMHRMLRDEEPRR